MTENDLFTLLLKCIPPQLTALAVRLQLDPAYLPGPGEAVATRAAAILELTRQRGDLAQLEQLLLDYFPNVKADLEAGKKRNGADREAKLILILAANPLETDRLRIDEEVRLIKERLNESEPGRRYRVESEWAVRVTDLSRYLLLHRPAIVHFSGHGSPTGDIVLETDAGQPQALPLDRLADLFDSIGEPTECVVLNACCSSERAGTLANFVGCVIGMAKEIGDASALRFAAGFYRGLAFGMDYYRAFRLGCNEIDLASLPDAVVPHFTTRTEDKVAQRTTTADVGEAAVELVSPHRTWVAVDPALPPPRNENAPLRYSVWYGTNRRPKDPANPAKGFSAERDTQVHFGTCEVAVPKYHISGSLGSPWWKRFLTLTDDRLKLKATTHLAEPAFWAGLAQVLNTWDGGQRTALVFIHGYNIGFEEAALRAAQLGVDLKVPGVMAFFSWPSKGTLLGYPADEASIEASETAITQFLTSFTTQTGAERVHVLAHSMGNRGLLRAMQRILQQAGQAANKPFGQIFLAAPDVDTDLFRDLARAYPLLSQRTTLYVSSRDRALASSGFIRDAPRAGYTPPVTVLPDIDTVDVSNADLTFLGHGYYGAAEGLLYDMHELLWHNSAPDVRRRLAKVVCGDGNETFWQIGR